jgi:hypothetical protein
VVYRVRGFGFRAPPGGHDLRADTAQEALLKLRVAARLFDQARAWDDRGRELGPAELERLAERETAADREALRRERETFWGRRGA